MEKLKLKALPEKEIEEVTKTGASGRLRRMARSAGGFTLIEVMIGLAIVGLCMVGLYSLLPLASRTLLGTDIRQTATNLATAEMEYLKNNQTNPYEVSKISYTLANLSSQYPGFTVTDTVTLDPQGENTMDMQQITVTVSQGGKVITTLEGYKLKDTN